MPLSVFAGKKKSPPKRETSKREGGLAGENHTGNSKAGSGSTGYFPYRFQGRKKGFSFLGKIIRGEEGSTNSSLKREVRPKFARES